jgi:hypothetical protein
MKITSYLVLLVLAAFAVYGVWQWGQGDSDRLSGDIPSRSAEISTFEDCKAAGYPVMESYPARCSVPDGRVFTQDISQLGNELEVADEIVLERPSADQVITSPLQIKGAARGSWYFEADFPIELFDADGNLLGSAIAQAEGEWMTEEFVPFSAILEFAQPATATGRLVLSKDNPSGLSELDRELWILVWFEE